MNPFTPPFHLLRLHDGRVLAVAEYGAAAGRPLIYLHGGGSSRLEPAYADGHAREQGIRLIGIDRPGFGLSTPDAAMSFQSVGDDLIEAAGLLGIERFGVAGMSAGGPYALHLAARHAQRVAMVALINSSMDWFDALAPAPPLFLRLIGGTMPEFALRFLGRRFKNNPAGVAAHGARLNGWDPDETRFFADAVREGFRQEHGVEHFLGEARRVIRQPWQLDWQQVRCPVLALCGVQDGAHPYFSAIARRQGNVSFLEIPGKHQAFINAQNWEAIGRGLKEALP